MSPELPQDQQLGIGKEKKEPPPLSFELGAGGRRATPPEATDAGPQEPVVSIRPTLAEGDPSAVIEMKKNGADTWAAPVALAGDPLLERARNEVEAALGDEGKRSSPELSSAPKENEHLVISQTPEAPRVIESASEAVKPPEDLSKFSRADIEARIRGLNFKLGTDLGKGDPPKGLEQRFKEIRATRKKWEDEKLYLEEEIKRLDAAAATPKPPPVPEPATVPVSETPRAAVPEPAVSLKPAVTSVEALESAPAVVVSPIPPSAGPTLPPGGAPPPETSLAPGKEGPHIKKNIDPVVKTLMDLLDNKKINFDEKLSELDKRLVDLQTGKLTNKDDGNFITDVTSVGRALKEWYQGKKVADKYYKDPKEFIAAPDDLKTKINGLIRSREKLIEAQELLSGNTTGGPNVVLVPGSPEVAPVPVAAEEIPGIQALTDKEIEERSVDFDFSSIPGIKVPQTPEISAPKEVATPVAKGSLDPIVPGAAVRPEKDVKPEIGGAERKNKRAPDRRGYMNVVGGQLLQEGGKTADVLVPETTVDAVVTPKKKADPAPAKEKTEKHRYPIFSRENLSKLKREAEHALTEFKRWQKVAHESGLNDENVADYEWIAEQKWKMYNDALEMNKAEKSDNLHIQPAREAAPKKDRPKIVFSDAALNSVRAEAAKARQEYEFQLKTAHEAGLEESDIPVVYRRIADMKQKTYEEALRMVHPEKKAIGREGAELFDNAYENAERSKVFGWGRERLKGLFSFGLWDVHQGEKFRKTSGGVGRKTGEDASLVLKQLETLDVNEAWLEAEQLKAATGISAGAREYQIVSDLLTEERSKENEKHIARLLAAAERDLIKRLGGAKVLGKRMFAYRSNSGEKILTEERLDALKAELEKKLRSYQNGEVTREWKDMRDIIRKKLDPNYMMHYVYGGLEAVAAGVGFMWLAPQIAGGLGTKALEGGATQVATNIGGEVAMKDTIWNTSKILLEQAGVINPGNDQITKVMEVMAGENNVGIKAWGTEGGVLDTGMQQGHVLKIVKTMVSVARIAGGL